MLIAHGGVSNGYALWIKDGIPQWTVNRDEVPRTISGIDQMAAGEHVLTIPGTTKLENLKSNLGSYDVELTAEELATLDALADRVKGERYDEKGMAAING